MTAGPVERPSPTQRAFRLGARGFGDQQSDRSRLLLIEIAIAVLVIFALSGLSYLELWRTAAQDLTRLLPSQTLVWADTPPPWANLDRVLAFDRWDADPMARELRLRQGFFATEPDGEAFGLPLEQIRQISRAADSLGFAIVPTEHGPSPMIFAEIRDLLSRKRVAARLAPFLEQVGRHVGFRIESVRRSPWLRYAGADLAAPRVVAIDPYLVFAWGEGNGLEDLLEARVGGESAPLRQRLGFEAMARARRDGDLVAFADPVVIWELLVGRGAAGIDAPPLRLVEGLDVVTGHARLDELNETFEIRARVHERESAERLELALVNRRHELVDLAPSEAPWVVSVVTHNPLATLSAARELISRLPRDLGAAAPLSPTGERLAAIELEAIVRLDWDVASAFAGEIAVMAMPPEFGAAGMRGDGDWAILVRPERPQVVESALERVLPFVLGDAFAYGRVKLGGRALHVVRPANAGEEGAEGLVEVLAWRLEDGLLELAPRVAVLERLRTMRRSAQVYGDTGLAARALAELPDESAVVAVLHPKFLTTLDAPPLELVARRLDPSFRVAVTLSVDPPWLELGTNLGPWSLAAALVTADREEINALTLPGLAPRCRAAHRAMCRVYPDAVPCRPLSLGRLRHVKRACEVLFREVEGPAP